MQNYSTTVEIGKGYKKIESGQKVKYFDQYYSFVSCKWKATTKQIGEDFLLVIFRQDEQLIFGRLE